MVVDAPFKLAEGIVDGEALPTLDDHRATVTVSPDSIGGRAYCNSYGGDLTVTGDEIVVSEIFMTTAGCDVPDAERAFVGAIGRVKSMGMDGDELVLVGPGVMLRFVALPVLDRADFAGTTWDLELLINGDDAAPPDHPSRLELRADGTFTAFTGCREVVGTWLVSGDQLGTPALDAFGVCAAHLTSQDSAFISAFAQGPARIEGDRLTMTGERGRALVFRATED